MSQCYFSIYQSKQKKVVTVENMRAAKNKHTSCICFEREHALQFFVQIEDRNIRSLWALPPGETYHDQSLGFPQHHFGPMVPLPPREVLKVFKQEQGTNTFTFFKSPGGEGACWDTIVGYTAIRETHP